MAGVRRNRFISERRDPSSEEPIYIEGINSLRSGLEAVVTRVTYSDARELIEDALLQVKLDAGQVMEAWKLAPADGTNPVSTRRRR